MRLPLTQAEPPQSLVPQAWPWLSALPDTPAAQPLEPPQEPGTGALPTAEYMAEAVLALLGGDESEKALAARVGTSLGELRRWKKVYTEAGLRALAALR